MILDIISSNRNNAFICNKLKDVKSFIDRCEYEGIEFSKLIGNCWDNRFIEDYDILYDRYSGHLNDDCTSYILIINTGKEFQFYSRSETDKPNHPDWNDYTYVSWNKINRELRLKELLDEKK